LANKIDNKQIRDEVNLSFVGLDADKGIILVEDLTTSLDGWRAYWEISASVFFYKELSTKPLPQDIRPQIKIKALKQGSFDVIGLILIPLGLVIGYDIVKVLGKWQWSLIKRHIKSKKELITKEEAIECLIKLSKKYEIETKNDLEVVRLLDSIDESLNSLVEPIDRSAKKIVIKSASSQQTLTITSSDKRALRSGYHLEPGADSQQFERFSIKFLRIHTETGNAIITFDNPSGINQIGHEYSTIIDPRVKKVKNIYTRALYEGTSLEVWGRKVFNKTNNTFVHWEIAQNLPKDDNPLFDKKNKTDMGKVRNDDSGQLTEDR